MKLLGKKVCLIQKDRGKFMSDKSDKFCEALRVNLTRVENYISKVGENLKSASTTAEEEVNQIEWIESISSE